MTDFIPIGITRHEDGGSATRPLAEAACPACGYEGFWVGCEFRSDWNPQEAARSACPECGTTFELVARRVDDE